MEFRGSQEVQTVHAAAHGNLVEKVGKAKCFVGKVTPKQAYVALRGPGG
jgi:hypothetical protein